MPVLSILAEMTSLKSLLRVALRSVLSVGPTCRRAVSLWRAVLACGLLITSSGCEYMGVANTRIADVLARPTTYLGREVVLKGPVVQSLKLGPVVNSYWVSDGTGQIRISAADTVALPGRQVIVRGTVDCLAFVMGEPFGVYVREIRRR
jgi:hypothetical protein